MTISKALGSFDRIQAISISTKELHDLGIGKGCFRVDGNSYEVTISNHHATVNRTDKPKSWLKALSEFITHRIFEGTLKSRTVRIQEAINQQLSRSEHISHLFDEKITLDHNNNSERPITNDIATLPGGEDSVPVPVPVPVPQTSSEIQDEAAAETPADKTRYENPYFSPLMEEPDFVRSYNDGKPKMAKIPSVPRNLKTGWPLLQISMLTPSVDQPGKYENVLGGGKCHDLDYPFYFLAKLVKAAYPMKIKKDDLDDVIDFGTGTSGFELDCSPLIKITSEKNAYGHLDRIFIENMELPNEKLASSLRNVKGLATSGINLFDFAYDPRLAKKYSEEQLQSAIINQQLATFHEGQYFVDLGELLALYERHADNGSPNANVQHEDSEDEENDESTDVVCILKNLFKVDEFKEARATMMEE